MIFAPPVISCNKTPLSAICSAIPFAVILFLLLFLPLSAAPVSAATLTAATHDELATAISTANGNNEADIINITADITLTADLPDVTSDITFNGNGRALSGNDAQKCFVFSGANVTVVINSMTIAHCRNHDSTDAYGGAISLSGNDSNLTINDSVIRDSEAGEGDGSVSYGWGGGIYVENGSAANPVTLTINRSAIHGNNSSGNGGGLWIGNATRVTITNSSIYGNSGDTGAGIMLNGNGAMLKLFHVTIANNTGRATYNTVSAGGRNPAGGLNRANGRLEIRNSIITGNTNQNCYFGVNAANAVVLSDNIIYDHGIPVASHAQCLTGQSTADPVLASTVSGNPPYFALLPGSPAIDAAGDCTAITTVDQRGVSRPQGSACDIGAYEYVPPPPPPPAVAEKRDAVSIAPTPTRIPRPRVSTCLSLPAGIQVSGVNPSTQCQQVDGNGIGNAEVIAAGFRDGVDIWGWVLPDTRVCFTASGGRFKFIDTTVLPRVVSDLPALGIGGQVCATIDRAGIVVLQPGPPAPTATAVPPASWSLNGCMVRTLYALNLRAGPGGELIGTIPYGVTLTAFTRSADWFEVDYLGTRGWLANGYLEAIGSCG